MLGQVHSKQEGNHIQMLEDNSKTTVNSTSRSIRNNSVFNPCLTSCVVFGTAVCAIVVASSPAAVVPSSFRSGAFFVDCILICGGLEFDGKLLVDCSS